MDPVTTELPRTPGSAEVTRPVPTAPMVVPRVLGGYELGERVGEGGMGVVWRARTPDGREVAVKVLREHIAHDEQARARLRREVRTLARVHHPRVAAVIDADVEGPAPFIVTEFVPGPPLDAYVEEHGPLRGDALLRLGRGLGEALAAIHAAGIVHRDLKPGNVLMLGADPVVIDFGIAQVADDVRLTATGLVMGTPGYLSPEVVEGGAVSTATDWWGWAATLAFAVSGHPPFGRGPLTVVLDRVVRGRLQLEGVPEMLRPLLAAALDPDPARRPTQEQVLDGLERYARGEDVTGALPAWTRQQGAWGGSDDADATRAQPRSPRTRVAPQRRGVWAERPQRPGQSVRPGRSVHPVHQGPGGVQGWAGDQGVDPSLPVIDPATQPPAPGEQGGPDPRIGRSSRAWTLLAMLVGFVGLSAAAPVVAWSAYALWGVAARTVDASLTALVLRRHQAGPRRSDVPVAVLLSPWHLVSAALVTAFGLILPVGVAVVVAVTFSGLVSSSGTLGAIPVDHPVPLALGSLVGAWLGWWGLASRSLRRGSRTLVRGIVPPGPMTLIVTTLCVVGGGALAAYAYLDSGVVSWWPLGPDVDPRSWLAFG